MIFIRIFWTLWEILSWNQWDEKGNCFVSCEPCRSDSLRKMLWLSSIRMFSPVCFLRYFTGHCISIWSVTFMFLGTSDRFRGLSSELKEIWDASKLIEPENPSVPISDEVGRRQERQRFEARSKLQVFDRSFWCKFSEWMLIKFHQNSDSVDQAPISDLISSERVDSLLCVASFNWWDWACIVLQILRNGEDIDCHPRQRSP